MQFHSSDPQVDTVPTVVRLQIATEVFKWKM